MASGQGVKGTVQPFRMFNRVRRGLAPTETVALPDRGKDS